MGIHRALFIALTIGFAFVAGQAMASAPPTIAPQTCDPAYWNSMEAKAWLQAEREIIQNQNLIFKADSVLEYTCFDRFLSHTAEHAGNIFVHTLYFGREIIPRGSQRDPISMEYGLQFVVTESMKPYINANFGHKFLGGRSEDIGGALDDRTIGEASSRAPYTDCDVMAKIWSTAKCMNFVHNSAFEGDGFFPFDDIKDINNNVMVEGYKTIKDPRKYPDKNNPCADWSEWDNKIKDATNDANGAGDTLYKFQDPIEETYNLIRPKLAAKGESGFQDCNVGTIKTGITVKTTANAQGYPDGICTNPGCSYDEGGQCQ